MFKPYTHSLIAAIVGPAGAGKGICLAYMIILKLIDGGKVWSNMSVHTSPAILSRRLSPTGREIKYSQTDPLDWKLLYSLDELFAEGTVAIDEMGYFNGSRQSMTTGNRLINGCVRQVRHRCLDFWYTAKRFSSVDFMLRDETDLVIRCEDLCHSAWGRANHIPPGFEFCFKFYDVSGKMTGKRAYDIRRIDDDPPFISRDYFKEINFDGAIVHDCYDTREIIPFEQAMAGVELHLKKTIVGNNDREEIHADLKEKIMLGIKSFVNAGKEKIPTYAFWDYLKAEFGVDGDPKTLGRLVPREVRRLPGYKGYQYDFTPILSLL